jgi:hypothetical protein
MKRKVADMFGLIRNRFKQKKYPAVIDKIMLEGGFSSKFLKFYFPFRYFVMALGTFPAMLISWPIMFVLLWISPEPFANAFFDGIYWIVNDVIMFGHAAEHPSVSRIIAICVPSIFAYILILLESLLCPDWFKDNQKI